MIGGFATGINQSAAGSNLIVNNCEFRDNYSGVLTLTFSNTNTTVLIENSRFEYQRVDGVDVEQGAINVSIRNSVLTNNHYGVYVYTNSQSQPVLIVIDTCTIVHHSEGTHAETGAAGSATMRVTNSTIDNNVNGMVLNGAGAAIESYSNNRVTANTNNSTFSGTVLPKQ